MLWSNASNDKVVSVLEKVVTGDSTVSDIGLKAFSAQLETLDSQQDKIVDWAKRFSLGTKKRKGN